MGKSLNKVLLIGNVGQEPELKHTGSGKAVATFSLATSKSYKQGDDWKTQTQWHRILVWERLAENVGEHVHKGQRVAIEGELAYRDWEDQDGNKRTTTEIVARDVIFLGSGEGSSQDETRSSKPRADRPKPPTKPDIPPDDIPF